MLKSIFPTKVKDGLFVLTVALVVMGGSLYVDAVKGVLRGEKVHAVVYLEGGTVEETLTDGNMVTAFRRTVGKIDQVGFFTAEIVRPSEASRAKLEDIDCTPEQLAKLYALQKELAAQPEIVHGVKLTVLLYKEMFGPMWPLYGERSEAKIAAAGMLGEPYLQVYPGGGAGGLKEGQKLNFPKNDPAVGPGTPVFGKELLTFEEVGAAQQRVNEFKGKQAEFVKLLEEIVVAAARSEEKAPEKPGAPAAKPPADDTDLDGPAPRAPIAEGVTTPTSPAAHAQAPAFLATPTASASPEAGTPTTTH